MDEFGGCVGCTIYGCLMGMIFSLFIGLLAFGIAWLLDLFIK